MTLTTRNITKADFDILRTWFDQDRTGMEYVGFYSDPWQWMRLLGDNRLGFVALDGGRVIGFLDLDLDGDVCTFAFYLAPGARGRGYAPALLRLLSALAADRHVSKLVCSVAPGNTRSQRALGDASFLRAGVDEHEYLQYEKRILS